MLSADQNTTTAAAAAAAPATDNGNGNGDARLSSSWLPEFDSTPGISLDMLSLAASTGSGSLKNSPPQPVAKSLAAQNSSHEPTSPQQEQKQEQKQQEEQVQESCLDADAQGTPIQQPAPVPCASEDESSVNAVAEPNNPAATSTAGPNSGLLENYGLSFNFNTDPAIDDISAAPQLFSVAASTVSSAGTDSQNHNMQSDDAEGSQAQPQESSDAPVAQQRIKGRRASIASMLIRRASKYIDGGVTATPPTNAQQQTEEKEKEVEDGVHSSSDVPVEKELHPSKNESVVDVAAADAANDPGVAKDHMSIEEPVAAIVNTVKFSVDDCADAAEHPKAIEVPNAAAEPVDNASEDNDQSHAVGTPSVGANEIESNSDDKASNDNTGGPSDQQQSEPSQTCEPQHSDPQDDATAAAVTGHQDENTSSRSSGSSIIHGDGYIGVEPLAEEDSTSVSAADSRSALNRRSSRIFEGFTRKVQRVRQTTSMVLRRSVGSRLSIIPRMSQDNFAADSGSSVGGGRQSEKIVSSESPADASDRAAKAGAGAGAETVAETETVAATNQANATAAPTATDADVSDADDAASSVAKASLIDSKPRRSGRAVLARGLTTVKRGTNDAVRSSVTRVKSIFMPKRPVAA
ncbi:hypothetical protein LPJ72_001307 [Coemansia sp. Benny D160-2]|nr:hypothetical protein LPJ72_001307 [Coemansia sp. Benny D160-2]